MNVICSTIEATTATTQTIGTCIGLLSIIWSHASGIWHCAEGAIINPAISTICGPILGGGGGGLCGTIVGGGGAGFISGGVNFLGHILTQGLGEVCNTLLHVIVSILPK